MQFVIFLSICLIECSVLRVAAIVEVLLQVVHKCAHVGFKNYAWMCLLNTHCATWHALAVCIQNKLFNSTHFLNIFD